MSECMSVASSVVAELSHVFLTARVLAEVEALGIGDVSIDAECHAL